MYSNVTLRQSLTYILECLRCTFRKTYSSVICFWWQQCPRIKTVQENFQIPLPKQTVIITLWWKNVNTSYKMITIIGQDMIENRKLSLHSLNNRKYFSLSHTSVSIWCRDFIVNVFCVTSQHTCYVHIWLFSRRLLTLLVFFYRLTWGHTFTRPIYLQFNDGFDILIIISIKKKTKKKKKIQTSRFLYFSILLTFIFIQQL